MSINKAEIRQATGATTRQIDEAAKALEELAETPDFSAHIIGTFLLKKAKKIATVAEAARRYLQGERANGSAGNGNGAQGGEPSGERLPYDERLRQQRQQNQNGVVGGMLQEDLELSDAISSRRAAGIETMSNLMLVEKLQKGTHTRSPEVEASYNLLRNCTLGVVEQHIDPFAGYIGLTLDAPALPMGEEKKALNPSTNGTPSAPESNGKQSTPPLPNGAQSKQQQQFKKE